MATVDFYLVKEAGIEECYALVCQLVDKVYQRRQSLYIHTNSAEEAKALDDLLWTFRDDAFIPHGLSGATTTAIQLGYELSHQPSAKILLNLSPNLIGIEDKFERILEIVTQNSREAARHKYRHYREREWALTTHDLTKSN